MYDWEREALGVDTLGQIRGAVKTRMRVDLLNPSAQAWWIATLYGPFIWKTWRVGLLHGSIAAFGDSPVLTSTYPNLVTAGSWSLPRTSSPDSGSPTVSRSRSACFPPNCINRMRRTRGEIGRRRAV